MRNSGARRTDPAGLQPFRDAGLLLLLALLLGSVRIGGNGLTIPALEKLAGAHAAPAAWQLPYRDPVPAPAPAPATRPTRGAEPNRCEESAAPRILIETVEVDRQGRRVRVEAARTTS